MREWAKEVLAGCTGETDNDYDTCFVYTKYTVFYVPPMRTIRNLYKLFRVTQSYKLTMSSYSSPSAIYIDGHMYYRCLQDFNHFYQGLQNFNRVYRKLPAFTKQGLVSQVTHLCNVM